MKKNKVCIVTGSGGLIGSEAVDFFINKFDIIIGIDNNMREEFFGKTASTLWNTNKLKTKYPEKFIHYNIDIRNVEQLNKIFELYNSDIHLVVHTAAQPSHDWAATDPIKDFSVNALGTLYLLEATRTYSKDAVFIFTSTNKVYGDTPNYLPLIEKENRFEIDQSHKFYKNGIDESMSIDNSKHSVFGASKVSADIMCQEYGKYFGMNIGIFRGGCLTGPAHSGTELHGFLSYLAKCVITGNHYNIFGDRGKRVRDNIHSYDLINMFWNFYQNPKQGEVYNAGGGRGNECSIIEAINIMNSFKYVKEWNNYTFLDDPRIGDHIFYVTDYSKFQKDYPNWKITISLHETIKQILEAQHNRTMINA